MPVDAKVGLANAASPELTGGTGFTFEDGVAALYAAALLAETTAPGLPGRIVKQFSVKKCEIFEGERRNSLPAWACAGRVSGA